MEETTNKIFGAHLKTIIISKKRNAQKEVIRPEMKKPFDYWNLMFNGSWLNTETFIRLLFVVVQ